MGLTVLLALSCRGPSAPLPFEYAGCADTDRGCEIGGAPLRLFAAGSVSVTRDGVSIPMSIEPIAGGVRATWTTPTPGTLLIRDGDRAATLTLLPAPTWAWRDALVAARAQGLAACRSVAEERLADATDADRGGILRILSGCELDAGDPGAYGHLRASAEAFARAGRPFDAYRARCALSSVLFGTSGTSLAEIETLLDGAPTSANADTAWAAAWHRGLLHRRTGNYRAALEDVRVAEEVATRLGLEPQRQSALWLRASTYAELGRYDDAIRAQRAVVDASPFPEGQCGKSGDASQRTALAWFLILEARSTGTAAPDAIPILEQVGRYHRACGHFAHEIANVELNLAIASWLGDDPAGTRAHLDAVRATMPQPDPLYAAELASLEAEVALRSGDAAAAERTSERMLAVARLRASPQAEAEALAGRAEARRALGRTREAADDYAAAHEALWAATTRVPLEAGAASFLSARAAMTERYVSLLLELGRPEQAMDVVRRARSHLVRSGHVAARLASLDPASQRRWDEAIGAYRLARAAIDAGAADSWTLSKDEVDARKIALAREEAAATRALDAALAVLGESAPAPPRTPAPGEVLLAWLEVGGVWIGFAATTDGVREATIGVLPSGDAALGAALFGPFSAQIRAAQRVVLLPSGDLRTAPLQALPFEGKPLLAHAPVVWSLDLGAAAPVHGGRLVVADPTGDLPGARAEAKTVSAAWPDAQVLSGEAATLSALRTGLGSAGAWHHAGHAFYRDGDVWQSGLRLADGVLRVGDVLALPRVPAEIVLSACDSSRSETAGVETWGLAQALVARGAAVVLATSRPVSDRAGSRLARSLYPTGDAPLDERARAAVLALHEEGDPDWTAFRVWTP